MASPGCEISETLTVKDMARDAKVSGDKVRNWCRAGRIEGAFNIGDNRREFWRAPRDGWERFKADRMAKRNDIIREVIARRRNFVSLLKI